MNRQRFYFILYQFIFYIVCQFLLRTVLLGMSLQVVNCQPVELVRMFVVGLAYDTVVGILLCLPLALFMVLVPARWLHIAKGRDGVFAFLAIMDFGIYVLAWRQLVYWSTYQSNFNYLVLEDFAYLTAIIEKWQLALPFLFNLLFFLLAAFLTAWLQMRRFHVQWEPIERRKMWAGVVAIVIIPILLIPVSSYSWRTYAGSNRNNREIAVNGMYALAYALRNQEFSYHQHYAIQDPNLVKDRIRHSLEAPNVVFTDSEGISRKVTNTNALSDKRPNIIFIIIGSMKYGRIGTNGEWEPMAPYLEELKKSSYCYSDVYAVDPHSFKTLETVATSIPSLPGNPIAQHDNSDNIVVLGDILEKRGYHRDFLYGSQGDFGGIRDFYATKGFTSIDYYAVKTTDLWDADFWSIPDGTLYGEALQEMDMHYKKGEPAYQIILTTVNRYPYAFPDGKVDAPSGTQEGAAVYSDWAMHHFLEQAAQKPWFRNTIFIIMADHEAKMTGNSELAVYRYRIPFLLYAPGLIDSGENRRLMSQVDIAPTLLGKLGISYHSHFLGRDIEQVPQGEECALIGSFRYLGYIKDDKLVILSPGKQVHTFRINSWNRDDLQPLINIPELTEEAISWYQGTEYLLDQCKLCHYSN